MKKTWRSILSLLMALVLVFGVFSSTAIVAFAADESAGGTSNDASSEQTNDAQLDEGWISVEYENNEMIVTLTPDLDALTNVSKDIIKELKDVVIEGIKEIGLRQLEDDIELGIGKDIGAKDLINYINEIKIDGTKIYGDFDNEKGYVFSIDTIIDLIRELPSFAEIAEMDDAEMRLSYTIDVTTDYGSYTMILTAVAGDGFDRIRQLAETLNEFVEIGITDNDEYILHVTVPAKVSDLLVKACESGRLTEAQKNQIFALLTYDVEEYIGLYNEKLTFANVMELLDSIDFEGLLDEDFIKDRIDTSKLDPDEIIAKVREFEKLYNKAFSMGSKLLAKAPASVLDKTVMSLYDGNGVFAFSGSKSVNIEEVLSKANEQYGELIASFIDKDEFAATVDFSMTLTDINRIDYKIGDKIVRSGLLPEGATVATFAAGIETDLTILGWMDENGKLLTKMPNADTVAIAITAGVVAGADVIKEYDGVSSTVEVIAGGLGEASLTYKWYKNGVLLSGIDTASFEVCDVADSGEYVAVVTVTYPGMASYEVTSDAITVDITPAPIDVSELEWNYSGAFAYDGSEKKVYISSELPDGVEVSYSGVTAQSAVGTYTAIATFTSNGNYVFVDGVDTAELEWSIAGEAIIVDSVVWNYVADSLVYNGEEQSVSIDESLLPEGVVVEGYIGNTATDAGSYTATVSLAATKADTAVVVTDAASVNLEWSIAKYSIDTSDLSWDNEKVYNGKEQQAQLDLSTVLEDLAVTLKYSDVIDATYTGNIATNVGIYTATATVSIKDSMTGNFEFAADAHTSFSTGWEITPYVINLSDLIWVYDGVYVYDASNPPVYNMAEHTVEISDDYINVYGADGNLLTILDVLSFTYNGAVEANAGSYTATAEYTFNIADTDNYSVEGTASLNWEIEKFAIDISAITWTDIDVTYNGEEQIGTYITIPVGISRLIRYELTGDVAIDAGKHIATLRIGVIDATNMEIDGATETTILHEWTMEKFFIDLSTVYWDYDAANGLIYNGKEQSILIKVDGLPLNADIADIMDIVYDGNTAKDAADYTAAVKSFTITDSNYAFKAGTSIKSCDYTIKPFEFKPEYIIDWELEDLTYNGEEQTVTVTPVLDDTVEYPEDFDLASVFTVTLGGEDKATDAGDYSVTVTVTENAEVINYVLTEDITADVDWSIAKLVINLDELAWNYDSYSDITYSANEYAAILSGLDSILLPDDIDDVLSVVYTDNKATAAGTYVSSANITLVAGAEKNYDLQGSVANTTWTVKKFTVDLSDTEWVSNTSLVYNGKEQKVSLALLVTLPDSLTDVISIEYVGNTAVQAGTYEAVASVSLLDTDNYEMIGTAEAFSWTVEKLVIDLADATWPKSQFTYNGSSKSVYPAIYVEIDGVYVDVAEMLDLEFVSKGVNENNISYVASAVNVGVYAAKISAAAVSAAHEGSVELVGTVEDIQEHEWEITRGYLDFSNTYWGYTFQGQTTPIPYPAEGIEYNGNEITLVLVNLPAPLRASDISYNKPTNRFAGDYVTTASLGYLVANNYDVSPEFEALANFSWTINPTDIDLSGVTFIGVNGASSDIVTTLPYANATYKFDVEFADGYVYPRQLADPVYTVISYTPATDVPVYIIPGVKLMGTYEVQISFNFKDEIGEGERNSYNAIEPWVRTVVIETVTTKEFNKFDESGKLIVGVDAENAIRADHTFIVNDDSHVYEGFYLSDSEYGRVVAAYDISFALDGTIMPQTGNSFDVEIYVPAKYTEGLEIKVVYVDEFGNVTEVPGATVNGDYVTFTTDHFSTYAVVSIEPAPVDPEYFEFPWWILIIVIIVLIIVIIIIVKIKRKGNDDEDDDQAAPITEKPVDDGAEAVELPEITEEEAAPAAVETESEEVEIQPTESEEVEIAPVVVEEPEAEQTEVEPEAQPEAEPEVQPEPVKEEAQPEPAATIVVPLPNEGEGIVIGGETVFVRYRSSFESRLIQSEPEIQDYYTVIKNTLLSYKGVKARTSWNYEAFNKARVQCAKLNIKGRSLIININLDPAEYNINKYHFIDMSDNPKFEQLPMQMKVRSDRALKYTVELIEEMMRKLDIPKVEPAANEDYHRPYETTEELAKKGLVKVILPPGMTLDENSNIVKINVGELIDNANANKDETEVAVAEAPVAEPVVEAPTEEPVVEAPAVVIPEEVVHVDAVEADELLTDEAAEAAIEVVHTGASTRGGKLCEINLDIICENFEDGETVNIESLKAKRLVNKNAGRIKVLARGVMTKTLTVIASKFSIQAVKMITLAGGHAEIED